MADVARFYDDLSASYHLLFEDWDQTIAWQAEILDDLLTRLCGPGPKIILDAACGIGTQALGFATKGHKVDGSDLSPAAITRAKREAVRKELGFGQEAGTRGR
jgi:methylase of polypeptide subunit release factors